VRYWRYFPTSSNLVGTLCVPKTQGLPKDVLIRYVHPESRYSVGLSRGRKGHGDLESQEMASFYANPLQVCCVQQVPPAVHMLVRQALTKLSDY